MNIKVCPKDQGEMREGMYTGPVVGWEKNEEKAFLKENSQRIATYACVKCGYMESYVRKV